MNEENIISLFNIIKNPLQSLSVLTIKDSNITSNSYLAIMSHLKLFPNMKKIVLEINNTKNIFSIYTEPLFEVINNKIEVIELLCPLQINDIKYLKNNSSKIKNLKKLKLNFRIESSDVLDINELINLYDNIEINEITLFNMNDNEMNIITKYSDLFSKIKILKIYDSNNSSNENDNSEITSNGFHELCDSMIVLANIEEFHFKCI